MTNNEYLQQQYREAMRSVNWISFNDWVAQRNPQSQRTWVGLTTDEFKFIASKYLLSREAGLEYFQEEIEAKLKEKNT